MFQLPKSSMRMFTRSSWFLLAYSWQAASQQHICNGKYAEGRRTGRLGRDLVGPFIQLLWVGQIARQLGASNRQTLRLHCARGRLWNCGRTKDSGVSEHLCSGTSTRAWKSTNRHQTNQRACTILYRSHEGCGVQWRPLAHAFRRPVTDTGNRLANENASVAFRCCSMHASSAWARQSRTGSRQGMFDCCASCTSYYASLSFS